MSASYPDDSASTIARTTGAEALRFPLRTARSIRWLTRGALVDTRTPWTADSY